jgi:uncharacterized phage-associated protein
MNSTTYTEVYFCEEGESLRFQDFSKIPYSYSEERQVNTDAIYSRSQSEINEKWITEENKQVTFRYDSSVSVFDVAAYILKKIGPMTTMKLQKLVYYSQAWSLVWDEKPLFKESIKAWANGPVIRELFNYHRGQYTISSVLIGNPDILAPEQKETIDAVIDYYGDKSSQWLIDLTHAETPWRIARAGTPENERGNKTVGLDVIAEYYSSLPPEE